MVRKVKRLTSGYFEQSFEERKDLNKVKKVKSLLTKLSRSTGKDDTGRISSRHKGSGAKRIFRIVSELTPDMGTVKVIDLQYDPNRSANIALVEIESGSKRYIIAPHDIKVGSQLKVKESGAMKTGDRAKLNNIPVGSQVHNIEIRPDSKGVIAKAAGTSATLMAIEEGYALLKMPSGELRRVHGECYASMGNVSNIEHSIIRIGKAGRSRHMGIRPTVRGKAMNPNSHPHGGGEAVNPIGLKYPKTPWGKVAIGKKTRKKQLSDKLIVKRRAKKKR
jgi:large subunit ribosomal protein L2